MDTVHKTRKRPRPCESRGRFFAVSQGETMNRKAASVRFLPAGLHPPRLVERPHRKHEHGMGPREWDHPRRFAGLAVHLLG